jgi:hypothetical protein
MFNVATGLLHYSSIVEEWRLAVKNGRRAP